VKVPAGTCDVCALTKLLHHPWAGFGADHCRTTSPSPSSTWSNCALPTHQDAQGKVSRRLCVGAGGNRGLWSSGHSGAQATIVRWIDALVAGSHSFSIPPRMALPAFTAGHDAATTRFRRLHTPTSRSSPCSSRSKDVTQRGSTTSRTQFADQVPGALMNYTPGDTRPSGTTVPRNVVVQRGLLRNRGR